MLPMLGTDQLVAPPSIITRILDCLYPLRNRDFSFSGVHAAQNGFVKGFSFFWKPAVTKMNVVYAIGVKVPHIVRRCLSADKQMEKIDDGSKVIASDRLNQLLC